MKCCLPFVAFVDSDKMVGVFKVDFGVYLGFSWSIQEVRYEWQWVSVLFCNSIQSSEIDTKPKGTVFLRSEEDWCSMRRIRWRDKTGFDMLIDKILESLLLVWREWNDTTERQ